MYVKPEMVLWKSKRQLHLNQWKMNVLYTLLKVIEASCTEIYIYISVTDRPDQQQNHWHINVRTKRLERNTFSNKIHVAFADKF